MFVRYAKIASWSLGGSGNCKSEKNEVKFFNIDVEITVSVCPLYELRHIN